MTVRSSGDTSAYRRFRGVGRARGGNAARWCVRKDLRREGHCAKKTRRKKENATQRTPQRKKKDGAVRQELVVRYGNP
jgi:hypothetical protein